MTYLDSLIQGLDIMNVEDFCTAVERLARHMQGLPPLHRCSQCGEKHDGESSLCMGCQKLREDTREDERAGRQDRDEEFEPSNDY